MGYFVAWMVLFPISQAICSKINPVKKEYSSEVEGAAAFCMIAIWISVGLELFEWASR